MKKVVGVKFKSAGKLYYFEPGDLNLKLEEKVIVETARGLELGEIVMECKEINPDSMISPLKKIIRLATDEDIKQYRENQKNKERALELCQEKIDKHDLDMKLIDVEYTFDKSKVIFYFTADGRVDFRELVRDLAGVFHTRIELRQIGVRDEAKMLGGIGNCGKGLCCNTWLTEFEPVSIKMAKIQNLSLNPSKISGVCGRLMCCLKFENDVYSELRKGMPDIGEKIKTPDGMAIVTEVVVLENSIKTRLIVGKEINEDGKAEDELSTEIYAYRKEEIKRNRRKSKKNKEKEEEELSEEMKDLLKD